MKDLPILRGAIVLGARMLCLSVFAVPLAGARGNALTEAHMLAKCDLSYHFETAPMAPIYFSEYDITIEPDRSVRLWYRFTAGNREALNGSAGGVTHKFRLNRAQYRQLIDVLDHAGVLAGNWRQTATLIGANRETVTIRESRGRTITISSALAPAAEQRFRTVVDAMRATVPMAAWIAKDNEQKIYQNSAR